MKLLQKIKNIMNLKQSMKRFGTKNLKESNLLKEAAANQQNWLKGYFKKQEGDEGT
tara:strand:- start:315 stop:482 length:168 start_codon:yes stop_codon:yes gene_type:complete